ncbi:MAG TPA: hemerythrin domain-containing protein [Noviherbaspirillum sp.]
MFNAMLDLLRTPRDDKANASVPQLMPAALAAVVPAAPVVKAPAAAAPPAAPQPEAKFRIPYDTALIVTLEQEHKVMLDIYAQIDLAVSQHQWAAVPDLLLQFRSKLTDHLLKEGVKLYAYLHKALQVEDEMTLVFTSFKKEMGVIGKVVFNFFDKYATQNALASAEQRLAFLEEFRSIGAVLVSRIQREEEQLYTIYKSLQ